MFGKQRFEDFFFSLPENHTDSKTIQESCENGRIRLCNGPSNTEGRVEVCINDVWGSVCDYQWGTADANVVCNQLGYYPTGRYVYSDVAKLEN